MNDFGHTAISHADAARLLEVIGFEAASARTMVTEYLHDCSRRVGVPVYRWGFDSADVEAIARDYEWVDVSRGETLAGARDRAARQAAWWAGRARTADPDRAAAFAEHADRQSQLWAARSAPTEPFTGADADQDDAIEQARRAVAALPTAIDDGVAGRTRRRARRGDGGRAMTLPKSLNELLRIYQAWSVRETFDRLAEKAAQDGDTDRAATLRAIGAREPTVSAAAALAAQHEVSSHLAGWEWHTIRAAREEGASWADIARATRTSAEDARGAYLAQVDRAEEYSTIDDAEAYRCAAGDWTQELHADTPNWARSQIEDAAGDSDRLAEERIASGRTGGDVDEWRLRPGDIVVIDESAMSDTTDLAAVYRIAESADAKLLLVGDHRQLAAIGAGGGMELVANAGASYELTDARRFAQEWERVASLRLRDGDESAVREYHKHGRLIDAGAVDQAEASAMRAWLGDTLSGKHSLLIVDQNEQAARLSAQLRAELVQLGRVAEHGVPLGLQGTFAGVGDIVQTRLNGWHLAGFDGNRRGPINRESYRVLDTRADDGLVVGLILGRTAEGEQLGERITLPGRYVSEHVALGYASTAHAAQGLTVDTAHGVVTWRTRLELLYVALTRGRFLNTAHVATVATVDDPAQGRPDDALRRSPQAVLGHVLETADPVKSALATATESAQEAKSVRTPVELLSDAIEIATAGRVAGWLDKCVDDGLLTPNERARLAAEDGAASLTRLLRRTELAGRDPEQELRRAVRERDFEGVRQLANVLHHRIAEGRDFEPIGSTFAEWTPRVDDPSWRRYLDSLAEAADARRDELGAQLAENPPAWAVEAFGAPPAALQERAAWERRAGTVAAHRELTGHDDPERALGDPPKAGQVEAYASWRAAWSALGRPKVDADELQMTDGRLYARVRAHEREELWAPRYVANELAATRQAAENYRRTAALRTAEADAAGPDDRAQLAREAAEASALAETLDAQITELELVDAARARWLTHTARTRVEADRAADALAARHAAREAPEPEVTAEEWLAAHEEAMRDEDRYREITDESEFVTEQPDHDRRSDDRGIEPEFDDIRAVAAAEPPVVNEDAVRVPSTEESADSVRDAQRALAEIAARAAADEAREADESRAAELARWHSDDEAVIEREATDEAEFVMDDGW